MVSVPPEVPAPVETSFSSQGFMSKVNELMEEQQQQQQQEDEQDETVEALLAISSQDAEDDLDDKDNDEDEDISGELEGMPNESFDSTLEGNDSNDEYAVVVEDKESSPDPSSILKERAPIKVKFSGMEGPSPPEWLSLEDASRAALIGKLGGLQERLTQTQVDLKKEKSNRRKKEKNIFKMAKELSKRQTEASKREQDIVKVGAYVCVVYYLLCQTFVFRQKPHLGSSNF